MAPGTDAAMKPDLICEWLGPPAERGPPITTACLAWSRANPTRNGSNGASTSAWTRCAITDGAPGAGDGSDEPAGPGLCLSDGAGQQAGLRRGPVRHGRPGGAGRGAAGPAGTARPAGLAVRPGRLPPFLIGHAAAVAAPARPAGGPAGNALARRFAGGGRTPRSCRRRRPAVAGGRRSGLGTRGALYRRIVATRRLLHVWGRLGKYVEPAKRRLSRAADGPELGRLLQEMRSLLRISCASSARRGSRATGWRRWCARTTSCAASRPWTPASARP